MLMQHLVTMQCPRFIDGFSRPGGGVMWIMLFLI